MVISYSVVLAISKASHKGIAWKKLLQQPHHIGFDISCFLHDFLGKRRKEFLRFHHDRPIDFDHLSQIFLRIIIKRQCPHRQPYQFIPITIYILSQPCIAIMQIILIQHIINVSSYIALCHCSIHVAYYQFIVIRVQIDLHLDSFAGQFQGNVVYSKIQQQFSDGLVWQVHRGDVSFLVQFEGHFRDLHVIHSNNNVILTVSRVIGPEANQERRAFKVSTFLFDNDGITCSRPDSILLEGMLINISTLHT